MGKEFITAVFKLIVLVVLSECTNLAVNRPTSQSSVFNTGQPHKAVDGYTGTSYPGPQGCTETNYEANPWWAVKLDRPTRVTSVKITNRGDCCGERLRNFNVGILSYLPANGDAFDPSSYPLCTHHTGAVSPGATVELQCTFPPVLATSLVVQIPGSTERLTLCEVQVFSSLNMTWMSSNAYEDETKNLFDKDSNTCVTKDRITPGNLAILGTLTIYDDTEGNLAASKNTITVAVKGTFSACDKGDFVFVEVTDIRCKWIRRCKPGATRNELKTSDDICFLSCECPDVKCDIKIIPWYGHKENGVERVCEILVFKLDNPAQTPHGLN